MVRSELIKARVSPKTKRAVEAAAERASVTVSGLLRGLIGQAISGRTMDGLMREDMLTVRAAANELLDLVDANPEALPQGRRISGLATTLHMLATRHLGPLS